MIKIPAKTFIPILSIVISSLILTFFLILPLLTWLQDIVDFYEPALNETTPTIVLKNGYIEFKGQIPQQITLADGVIIFFDKVVNDSLLQAAPVRSVFIAEYEMQIKTKQNIQTITFDNIKSDDDDVILEPLKVREKLLRYRTKIFVVISIVSVFFVTLFVFLLVFFAAGVGLMVDTFSNGPHTFKQMLNLSAPLLLVFILIGIIFQLVTFSDIKLMILLYILFTGVFVFLNTYLVSRVDKLP